MTMAGETVGPVTKTWIAHVPVPLFAVVMGLGGLGLAWRKAHEVLHVPAPIGEAILLVAAVIFVTLVVLYGLKALRHWEDVVGDFNHIIRVNFFPAMSISLLLLAIAALPHHHALAQGLWFAGAGLHLCFSLLIVNRWISRNVEIQHSNPSWFIPIVGNVLVPIAGVPLGHVEASWFFFSVGIVFWVLLFTIMLYRIIFHDPMPAKILPTLFILLAPPAIGFVAYSRFMGPELDVLGRVLYFTALFIALLLATLMPRFMRLPFFVSWWAFTFPSAALAIASLLYSEYQPGLVSHAIAMVILAVATLVIAAVWLRTARALLAGHIFVPEG